MKRAKLARRNSILSLFAAALFLLTAAAVMSQWGWGRRDIDVDAYKTARDIPSHSTGTPQLEVGMLFSQSGFPEDRFKAKTFVGVSAKPDSRPEPT